MKIEYDFSYDEILELIKYNKYTIRKLDRDRDSLADYTVRQQEIGDSCGIASSKEILSMMKTLRVETKNKLEYLNTIRLQFNTQYENTSEKL